jgi:glycosyltransferase involved in cell wall biosynthesis
LRYSLSEKKIPKTDIYIATAWSTAFWLNRYKNVDCRNKFYFIQHFEDWAETYDAVLETWKMKLTKIVIAPWLQKIATDIGEKCFLVENGFNQNEFYLIDTIEDRKKTAIMLWHDLPFKGCSMGIEALKHVKEVIPEFTVTLFGVPFPPPNLPSWIKYYQKPKIDIHRKLYNNAAIFVGTSYSEGWGLTVGEAMLCGCAIACTNNEGYAVVAHDNETALLSEIGDAVALSENIIHLIENDNLRIKIATSGNKLIKEYTWERAYKNFLTVIDI